MTKTIEGKHDSRTLFGRVFAGLQNRRLCRCLPMHVPRAIGWDVVANHVEVIAESPLVSLIRSLNVEHGRAHLFLGNDLGVQVKSGFKTRTRPLTEKAKGYRDETFNFLIAQSPPLGNHPLP